MPLDPQAQAVLDQFRALGARPFHAMSASEARQATARFAKLGGRWPAPAQVRDGCLPGPSGEVPFRLYTPPGHGPFPALVFFHGGGWVTGSITTHDPLCRALVAGAGCCVLSVDYHLAPEHRFPTALEECYAATRWVVDNADSLGIDATRVAVGGDSAGGNMAAVVARWARDRGGPPLVFQLLIYPVTDYLPDFPSRHDHGSFLSNADLVWVWQHYLPCPSEGSNPNVAPLQATDLSGLPPALVLTAEYDPLRDEGNLYAERLQAAGVPTVLARYDGMIHGFVSMAGLLEQGKQALEEAASALRGAFTR